MESHLARDRVQSSRSSAAIALSLIGGIIIILSGSGHGGIMMIGRFVPGFMGIQSFSPFVLPIVLTTGIVIVISAILLSKRPQQATIWGIIILVFSVLALFGMGLSVLGSIMGIIGGILVLTRR